MSKLGGYKTSVSAEELRWRRLLLRCLYICSSAQLLASLACISQTNQNSSSSSHLIDTQTINTDSIHQPFIVGGILSSCNQSLLITGDELLSTRHPPPGTSDCFPRSINGSIQPSGAQCAQCGEVVQSRRATRAFSWLKAPTSAFTFKTLLRHYAKRALTPR